MAGRWRKSPGHLAQVAAALSSALWLWGCVTSSPAPVISKEPPAPASEPATAPSDSAKQATSAGQPKAERPEYHIAQKGETLFSIARQYGVSHHELGLWNGLENVNAIREGQRIRLSPPPGADSQVTVIPLHTEPSAPVGRPIEEAKPTPSISGAGAPPTTTAPAPGAPSEPALKVEPKVAKTPYSDRAWAQFKAANEATEPAETKPAEPEAKIERKVDSTEPRAPQPPENESLQWVWPSTGKIGAVFNESTKGLVIVGAMGQPVYASADGQVSYIGNSLRGYGKMVVIKHNKTFLSVYAHNSAILVREGQRVARGQKIAEMGNSDSDDGSVKLHFEIRRLGKPVDPMKYLPNERPS